LSLAGFDRSSDPPLIAWHDPADNLVGGQGVHRFSSPPTWGMATPVEGGLRVEVDGEPYLAFAVVNLVRETGEEEAPADPSGPTPEPAFGTDHDRFVDAALPDLSQHTAAGWDFNCGPTAAANALLALASRDAGLAETLGVALPLDASMVEGLIYGPLSSTARLHLPEGLVGLMDTSIERGTTGSALIAAFERVFERVPGHTRYTVRVSEKPDRSALLSGMELLRRGGAGLLLIHPAMDPGNDAQPRSGGSPEAGAAIPGGAARSPGVELPPVPGPPPSEPSSLTAGQAVASLTGSWKQIDGPQDADFGPGNYRDSTLLFSAAGVVEVRRTYDTAGGTMVLARRLRLKTAEAGRLDFVDFAEGKPGGAVPRPDRWLVGSQDVDPPLPLPMRLTYAREGDRLRLGEKIYRRQ